MRALFVIDMQEEYVGQGNRYGYDSSVLISQVNQRILQAQQDDYLNCIKAYNTKEISSQLKQDVLVMAGSDDMYTVFFDEQIQSLRNAKSVNGRIFTKAEWLYQPSKSCVHRCRADDNEQLSLVIYSAFFLDVL